MKLLLTILGLAAIFSVAEAKETKISSKKFRKTASANDGILYDCGSVRLTYGEDSNYVEGFKVGPRFELEDVDNQKSYPAYVGNLNSEGGEFIVEKFRGNLMVKIQGMGPSSLPRVASLSDGQKLPCKFTPPSRR